LSWSKPNFTCPHKYLLNRQIEPNITSPRNFSIGRHEIKYIFELYGGMKVICTIVFNVRLCRKYILSLYIIWLYVLVKNRLLILEWGEGGQWVRNLPHCTFSWNRLHMQYIWAYFETPPNSISTILEHPPDFIKINRYFLTDFKTY
jgi:hypothetical protein